MTLDTNSDECYTADDFDEGDVPQSVHDDGQVCVSYEELSTSVGTTSTVVTTSTTVVMTISSIA